MAPAGGAASSAPCHDVARHHRRTPSTCMPSPPPCQVWEPTIVALFQRLGNDFANSLWEGRLQGGGGKAAGVAAASRQAGGSVLGTDPFSAESDDEADVLETARRAAAAAPAAAGPGGSATALPARPGPMASDQEREAFITAKVRQEGWDRCCCCLCAYPANLCVAALLACPHGTTCLQLAHSTQLCPALISSQYVDRAFVVCPPLPPGDAASTALPAWLWEAVARGDLGGAYAALAAGADVNARFSSQPSAQLVWESNLQVGHAVAGSAKVAIV